MHLEQGFNFNLHVDDTVPLLHIFEEKKQRCAMCV